MVNLVLRIKRICKRNILVSNIYWQIRRIEMRFFIKRIIRNKYRKLTGKILNLDNPRGFNEKLQWIKLNIRDPLMTICADKLESKKYVKSKIKEIYIPKVYKVWNRAEDIDFSDLPEKFVIKSNHASGEVIIVKNKNEIKLDDVKKKVKIWLRENYYYKSGEWCYKNIVPKIYVEELLDIDMVDYKFYCFNGVPKFLYVSQGLAYNHAEAKMCFMSLKWEKTPFQRLDFKQFEGNIEKPLNLDKMIDMAKSLSKEFSFCRVDFYDSSKRGVIFSEMTFYPATGCALFYPLEWEYKIGDMLQLPIDE